MAVTYRAESAPEIDNRPDPFVGDARAPNPTTQAGELTAGVDEILNEVRGRLNVALVTKVSGAGLPGAGPSRDEERAEEVTRPDHDRGPATRGSIFTELEATPETDGDDPLAAFGPSAGNAWIEEADFWEPAEAEQSD